MGALSLDLEPAFWVLAAALVAIACVQLADRIGQRRAIRRTRKAIARFMRESPDA